jgi:hypothetical protein
VFSRRVVKKAKRDDKRVCGRADVLNTRSGSSKWSILCCCASQLDEWAMQSVSKGKGGRKSGVKEKREQTEESEGGFQCHGAPHQRAACSQMRMDPMRSL